MSRRFSYGFILGALVAALVTTGITTFAQMKRPFHNGSVWTMDFIRMTPGMENAYLNYLAAGWKEGQEAAKKEGLILSYKVLAAESHSPTDWNIILMTEHKDLATMEANQGKGDALTQKVVGDDQKQMQGYKERAAIREIIADRLVREVVLAPKP